MIAFLMGVASANIPRSGHHNKESLAFISSGGTIITSLILFAIGIFPNLVLSNPNPEYSLNLYNASSSQTTLEIILTIAIIGIPFVLAYTISIYWIFSGKVKIDSSSY